MTNEADTPVTRPDLDAELESFLTSALTIYDVMKVVPHPYNAVADMANHWAHDFVGLAFKVKNALAAANARADQAEQSLTTEREASNQILKEETAFLRHRYRGVVSKQKAQLERAEKAEAVIEKVRLARSEQPLYMPKGMIPLTYVVYDVDAVDKALEPVAPTAEQ